MVLRGPQDLLSESKDEKKRVTRLDDASYLQNLLNNLLVMPVSIVAVFESVEST